MRTLLLQLIVLATLLAGAGVAQAAPERITQESPDSLKRLYNRGVLYNNSKNYERALAYFDRALAMSPDNSDVMVGKAYVFINQHKYAEAADWLNRAARIDTENATSYLSLATSLLEIQADEAAGDEPEYVPAMRSDEIVAPEFPGGTKSLKAFIKLNLRYPKKARKNYLGGRIYVDCLVDKTGRVVETKVHDGIDPELDAEALRICNLLPQFIPGTEHGEPAEFWVKVPVDFILD